MSALLEVRELVVAYDARGGRARAVDGASLDVLRGETLALVGESGSGKTSLGRAILRLVPTASGSVRYDGDDVLALAGNALRRFRRKAQVVFQDPNASLDPRMRVGDVIREGIDIHALASRADANQRVARLLEEVGLSAADAERLPHEFSGGERQRIAIARALAVEPEFLVLDEAVSALDVLVRRQVLDLLAALQAARGLTYLFIAHDLAVVERIATRVAVMQQGRIVECAPTAALFAAPASVAAQALLAAIPRIPW
jgi:ABC-type glutathione transport system ATPase component